MGCLSGSRTLRTAHCSDTSLPAHLLPTLNNLAHSDLQCCSQCIPNNNLLYITMPTHRQVLSASAVTTAGEDQGQALEQIRTYAHCTAVTAGAGAGAGAGRVTLMVLNLDNSPKRVSTAFAAAAANASTITGRGSSSIGSSSSSSSTHRNTTSGGGKGGQPTIKKHTVTVYQLAPSNSAGIGGATGVNGTLIQLNGKTLGLDASSGDVPELLPLGIMQGADKHIVLAPQSITFVVYNDANAAACA